jgi:hypothetical protein
MEQFPTISALYIVENPPVFSILLDATAELIMNNNQIKADLIMEKGGNFFNTINEHIKHIYHEGELFENATIRFNRIVQNEGQRNIRRRVSFYNLEMIIAIGYRIRSHRGTQFRRWVTERLNEYLVKGFTMDDERLKEIRHFGQDYFEELLARIRDIRASEKRFYKKITDICALSIDYEPHAAISQNFFSTVQNKLHFAIHGQTAAELIVDRANSEELNMGLTSSTELLPCI